MISIDWKARLRKDTEEYLKNKLPKRDFDIDIIYNAYPERVDNNIPKEVVSLVAKQISAEIVKDPDSYMDFYDYLWKEKGDSGKLALSIMLARLIKKDPRKYFEYSGKLLTTCSDNTHVHYLLDKVIYPLFKKHPDVYLDKMLKWLSSSNEILRVNTIKLFIKLVKSNKAQISNIFKRLEGLWLYANEEMINLNIEFLKAVSKIDREFYKSVFLNYGISRNPIFVEILAGSISFYDPEIYDIVEKWTKSGNARLKKAALTAYKILQRKKG